VETIKNLSKEIREMHSTVKSLVTNTNILHNQNPELKARYKRVERQRLGIGSHQAQARQNDNATLASNANETPFTNKRQSASQSNTSGNTQAPNQSGVLPVSPETWTMVAKK
jgi:TolA-binding protein